MFQTSKFFNIALIALTLTACGGKKGSDFLLSADVSVVPQPGYSFITLTAVIDSKSARLLEITDTIKDPQTQTPLGTVKLTQLDGNKTQVQVGINSTLIGHASPDLGLSLPNGNPLPFSLAAREGEILGIPFRTNSRIYIGGSTTDTVIAGIALTIKGFDDVIDTVGFPSNVFFMVPFSANFSGYAGVYASPAIATSGIAVFGKYVKNPTIMAQEQNDMAAQAKDLQALDTLDEYSKNRLMDIFYGEEREFSVY